MQNNSTREPFFPPNLDDYAPWVAARGLVAPYGECQCGCGQAASLARNGSADRGYQKGKPVIYAQGHKGREGLAADTFWLKFTPGVPDECWEWQGNVNSGGYGDFTHKLKHILAHRFSYELHYGPIPDKLWVLHKCDNPRCVNPNHLFLGTRIDNARDMVNKDRQARGERNRNARLTESVVLRIREQAANGIPHRKIAESFGVCVETVRNIQLRLRWKHLP